MSEAQVIEKTPRLNTRESLARDFSIIGMDKGVTVIVRTGWLRRGKTLTK